MKGNLAQSHNIADTWNPEILLWGIHSEDTPHKYETTYSPRFCCIIFKSKILEVTHMSSKIKWCICIVDSYVAVTKSKVSLHCSQVISWICYMKKTRRSHAVIYMTETRETCMYLKKPESLREILTDCVSVIPFPLVVAKTHICLRWYLGMSNKWTFHTLFSEMLNVCSHFAFDFICENFVICALYDT